MTNSNDTEKEDKFQPKDAVGAAIQGLTVTGTAGLFIAAAQNALAKQNHGIFGAFTKSGGTVAGFAAVGGTYTFVREASANLREKRDSINSAIGGFFAGGILGLRYRAFPPVLGFGVALAALMAVYEKGGGSLRGAYKAVTIDEVERKEMLRKNRRRPFEETVEEIGEGRGIYGPGYAERRRQKILDKYGIEVPATSTAGSE